MKMLFCENCGDLVVPSHEAYKPQWCRCNASCCWWINPSSGEFACWSQLGRQKVSVIGINNSLLTVPFSESLNENDKKVEFGCIQKDAIEAIIDNTPDSYLFKQLRSLIVRFRPGYSTDTFFAQSLPPAAYGG
jgi:hypothetical protein